MVEIECDTLEQVAEAARAGADAVLLDNMDPGDVVEAIAVAQVDATRSILTEVSGGVTLATIGAYAGRGPGPDLGRRVDPLGHGARPRARSDLDGGGRRRGARRGGLTGAPRH